MSRTVLIVEDERSVAELLDDYLQAADFTTHIIDDGDEVVAWVRRNSPALVLLDLMLPGTDGITLCKEIRSFSSVPIIMATARVDEIDRLIGLELGADDYICKPFSPREVVARAKAVLRRSGGGPATAGDLISLDKEGFRAYIRGEDLKLTKVEFQLFAALYSQPERIFSRDQLIRHIYQDQRMVSDRTVDSHIKKLRLKISRANPRLDLIVSVYGIGYRLQIPVNS